MLCFYRNYIARYKSIKQQISVEKATLELKKSNSFRNFIALLLHFYSKLATIHGELLYKEGIKYTRKVAYLSQEYLAKEICVSFSTVNRWERGKSKPNYAAMKKINAFCNANSIKVDFDEDDS